MSSLLGIDLGTSSVKVVAFAVAGVLKGVGMAEYPILTPRLGYAEQDPEEWWRATKIAVRKALEKAGHPEILGIGFSGQMHGEDQVSEGARLGGCGPPAERRGGGPGWVGVTGPCFRPV